MTAAVLVAALLAAPPSGAQWLGPRPPAAVKRVVTIAPSLTDSVLRLGAGERLVGVSRFDEAKEVAALPRVGGFNDPSIEAVVALKPDLVVVQKAPANQRPVEKLAELGVPVLALPLTSVADVLDSLRVLGAALDKRDAAAALVRDIEAARAAVRARAKQRQRRPRVLFVYGFSPLVVAGPGSFAHELLADCGAENIVEKAPTAYPVYSAERAVRLKPDIVIDAADVMDGKEQVRSLAGLSGARWVTLESKELLHPGPSLATGLETLARLLE